MLAAFSKTGRAVLGLFPDPPAEACDARSSGHFFLIGLYVAKCEKSVHNRIRHTVVLVEGAQAIASGRSKRGSTPLELRNILTS